MRPDVALDSPVRARRKSGSSEGSTRVAVSQEPTTFFLASQNEVDAQDELDIAAPQTSTKSNLSRSEDEKQATGSLDNSVFGVHSLSESKDEARSDSPQRPHTPPQAVAGGQHIIDEVPDSPTALRIPDHLRGRSATIGSSTPLTPVQTLSPGLWSGIIPGTPKSMSLASIGISDQDSHHDLDDENVEDGTSPSGLLQASSPDLIMPSLAMPDRRPFTQRGKDIGRLRLAVAGRRGIGKSSLIRAIVQQCEDIVQVDPFAATPETVAPRLKSSTKSQRKSTNPGILEIMASTKAYPSWWTESMEESKALRRRKSNAEVVLERNICFIDTPGFVFGSDGSSSEVEDLVTYLENSLWQVDSMSEISALERLQLVSGRGSCLVDAVLFLFSEEQYFEQETAIYQRLASLTSVIPLIAKSDQFSSYELSKFKAAVLTSISKTTKPFMFRNDLHHCLHMHGTQQTEESHPSIQLPPFAVSSIPDTANSEMDASLLMASTYQLPLITSELSSLIDNLFDPEHIPWLRHLAAQKYLAWRDRQLVEAMTDLGTSTGDVDLTNFNPQRRERLRRLSTEAGALIQRTKSDATTRPPPFKPRWSAPDIWRDAFILDGLPQHERARWLLQKVNEEVCRGSIGPLNYDQALATAGELPEQEQGTALTKSEMTGKKQQQQRLTYGELPAWARQGRKRNRNLKQLDPNDPLGLVKTWDGWNRVLKWSIGGGVVLGTFWAVVIRNWLGWNETS